MNQRLTKITTELTAIAGISLPKEDGYIKLSGSDAQGFIRIARDLLPVVEVVCSCYDELVEVCGRIVAVHEHFNKMLEMKLPCEDILGAMDALMDSNVAYVEEAIAKAKRGGGGEQ